MCSKYSLEINIRCIEGLTIGKKLIRKNVFVVVRIDDQDYTRNHHEVSTRLCEENEINPTWNEKLVTTIQTSTKCIVLDVRHRIRSKEKVIAVAKVPISDFVSNCMPTNYVHFLSYRLRDYDGEPNGIINFSVIVKGKVSGDEYGENYKGNEIQGYGYKENQLPKQCNGTPFLINYRRRNCNDVVIGVPAGWSNSTA